MYLCRKVRSAQKRNNSSQIILFFFYDKENLVQHAVAQNDCSVESRLNSCRAGANTLQVSWGKLVHVDEEMLEKTSF